MSRLYFQTKGTAFFLSLTWLSSSWATLLSIAQNGAMLRL